jgi:hypothetical protein
MRLYVVVTPIVVFGLTIWVRRGDHLTWTSAVLGAIGPTVICVIGVVFIYRLYRRRWRA